MVQLRLGVDVGGTFTDVVAVDAGTRTLVARVKVPTTHDAPEGVAAGIVAGIDALLQRYEIEPANVAFIAHSTTQATNALLEGDIANVGVLGLTRRFAWIARTQMRFRPLRLASEILFAPSFRFSRADDASIDGALEELLAAGATAIAVSEPFSVDDPARESRAAERARSRGCFATSGAEVSSLYGLRARTRTAAINAAILPKMVRTSRMTAEAVRRAKIEAPLMIMRSDGGVMDVGEIETRPILTMLSGPAAGVAGALHYENVTDGIFIEVGGTSSDCCAIRAGRPQMHPARIGGHRTMLRTIDSRTLGIGGGSMPRVVGGHVIDVGPRSAHIAGCCYAAFLAPADFAGARIESLDYLRIVLRDGRTATLTPTCAANFLDRVPPGAFATGNLEAVRAAFELVAAQAGSTPEMLANEILDVAIDKVRVCVEELLVDYALDRQALELVGGGGGAGALIPSLAARMNLRHRIARDAEVISPIGVALALVRDVVERTIADPTPEDIATLRREVSDRVIAAGAAAETIEVSIEIDSQRNRVRASASGATAMAEGAQGAQALQVLRERDDVRVVDERGVTRLVLRGAEIRGSNAGRLEADLREALENATSFGDVGRALPSLHLVHGARIADFSGLGSIDQAVALALEEVGGRETAAPVAIVTVRSRA